MDLIINCAAGRCLHHGPLFPWYCFSEIHIFANDHRIDVILNHYLALAYVFQSVGAFGPEMALWGLVGLAKQLALYGEPYFARSLRQEAANSFAGLFTAGVIAFALPFASSLVPSLSALGLSSAVAQFLVTAAFTLCGVAVFYNLIELLLSSGTGQNAVVRF